MKKRSLVAAIAMLVVSAIVLTSSTYAWFSANDNAKVEGISASVSNSNGTITLTPKGTNKKTSEPSVALSNANWYLPTSLQPVSMSASASGLMAPNFKKVNFDGVTYSGLADAAGGSATTATAAASEDYVKYSFTVNHKNAGDEDATITMTIKPSFTNTTYVYGMVVIDSATASEDQAIVFSVNANSYYPLLSLGTGSSAKISENTSSPNSIVDTTDTLVGGGAVVSGTHIGSDAQTVTSTNTNVTLTSPHGGTAASAGTDWDVTVYLWAEGQDADCTGSASSNTCGIDISFTVA